MQKFKYKFTPLALVFIILGMISGLACVVLNVIRFISLLQTTTAVSSDYMSASVSAIIGVIAIVVLLAVVLNSYYSIENKDFVARWGFFANKIPLKDITGITLFRLTDKLVIYYSTDNFFVINAKRTDYENVITALMSANNKIVYIENSENGNE